MAVDIAKAIGAITRTEPGGCAFIAGGVAVLIGVYARPAAALRCS